MIKVGDFVEVLATPWVSQFAPKCVGFKGTVTEIATNNGMAGIDNGATRVIWMKFSDLRKVNNG
jgi:hypothetical protein